MEWRKRLVNKKRKSLPAHGAERQLMAPGGQLMAENDSSWTRPGGQLLSGECVLIRR
jgi:hypothetical protein